MDSALLRAPLVRRSVEAINAGNIDEFMALFAPDAVVTDGPTYDGAVAIREWAARETIGVSMRFDGLRELNVAGTMIALTATSTGGYNGPLTFEYTVHDGLIARLDIR